MSRHLTAVVLSFMFVGGARLIAQDSTPKNSDQKKTLTSSAKAEGTDVSKKSGEAKQPLKVQKRSRLPRFYGKLELSPEQREKVYSVQQEYEEQLDALAKQIEALKAEREKKTKSILTASQKQQLSSFEQDIVAKSKTKQVK